MSQMRKTPTSKAKKRSARSGNTIAFAGSWSLVDVNVSKVKSPQRSKTVGETVGRIKAKRVEAAPKEAKPAPAAPAKISAESEAALARVVATANLIEKGAIKVNSAKGMSDEDFLALIEKSIPAA